VNTLTLYYALQRTRAEMDTCADLRQSRTGIITGEDVWAARWRRYHRLYCKLEQTIIVRLGGLVHAPVCLVCGGYRSACSCERRLPVV